MTTWPQRCEVSPLQNLPIKENVSVRRPLDNEAKRVGPHNTVNDPRSAISAELQGQSTELVCLDSPIGERRSRFEKKQIGVADAISITVKRNILLQHRS